MFLWHVRTQLEVAVCKSGEVSPETEFSANLILDFVLSELRKK